MIVEFLLALGEEEDDDVGGRLFEEGGGEDGESSQGGGGKSLGGGGKSISAKLGGFPLDGLFVFKQFDECLGFGRNVLKLPAESVLLLRVTPKIKINRLI